MSHSVFPERKKRGKESSLFVRPSDRGFGVFLSFLSLSPRRPPYDPPEEEGRKEEKGVRRRSDKMRGTLLLLLSFSFYLLFFPAVRHQMNWRERRFLFSSRVPFFPPFFWTLFIANARRERSGDGGMGTGQRAEEAQWKREREGASFSRRSRERAKGFPSSFRSSPAHFLVPTARSVGRRLS